MAVAVSFENIAKQYRVGEIGTGTISRDLERAWARLRGKPDPYGVIGEVNDRTTAGGEFVWALKDISFQIDQGEVFGIVGRNGAGKSTLLKILSRITAPTIGRVRANGRIASLLEVGTGFHPEFTGRENIYLNGALLGMTHREITQRLDDIIEFSGCAKFIDTPVKRYSSGMTVRLGFSVAAHLECEIIVVDEVLAVGDAFFQQKCIERMTEIAADGRTILFVSHNLQAVEQLCTRACYIEHGQLGMIGEVAEALKRYLIGFTHETFNEHSFVGNAKMRRGYGTARVSCFRLEDEFGTEKAEFEQGDKVRIIFSIRPYEPIVDYRFFIKFSSGVTGEEATSLEHILTPEQSRAALESELAIEFDTSRIRPGIYPLYIWIGDPNNGSVCYDCIDNATKPLLITKNGSANGTGVFDLEGSGLPAIEAHKHSTVD